MEAYLDEQALTATGTQDTLADVIASARDQAAKDDRVIVSVLCDGLDISDDGLEARQAEPADGFGRIDFKSGLPADLVKEALTHALNVLDETDSQRERAVDALTQGDAKQATEALGQCFRNWGQIHTAVIHSIAMLGVDLESFKIGSESIESVLLRITDQLKQVKEVLLAGDHVLLADLLQYEFSQATDAWKGAVQAVLTQAEIRAQSASDGSRPS